MLFAGHQIMVQFRYKMHELHLANNNMFYTLIVSTNRYLWSSSAFRRENVGGKLSILERIQFSQHLVFHYVCDALSDAYRLLSISKTKRRDQIRSRTKRYKTIAIGTARIGKVSTFYNSLSIFYNSLLDWDQVGKAIKRIRGTFEEKEKE